MRVRDLLEILSDCDEDDLVIIKACDETCEFEELYAVEKSRYSELNGNIKPRKLTQRMIDNGYTEEDIYTSDQGIDCVVLWP